jgi:hypothetical protein
MLLRMMPQSSSSSLAPSTEEEQLATTKAVALALGFDQSLATDDVMQMLRSRVDELLRGPRRALMAALYRFDVSEPATRSALAQPDLRQQGDALTSAILDRALQKQRTRARWADEFSVS